MAIKAALQEPRIATSLVGFCRPEEVRSAGKMGFGFRFQVKKHYKNFDMKYWMVHTLHSAGG